MRRIIQAVVLLAIIAVSTYVPMLVGFYSRAWISPGVADSHPALCWAAGVAICITAYLLVCVLCLLWNLADDVMEWLSNLVYDWRHGDD